MNKTADNKISIELKQVFKLFIQYLGVTFSSIPFGALYYGLISANVIPSIALILSLISGGGFAVLIWRYIENNLFIGVKPHYDTDNNKYNLFLKVAFIKIVKNTENTSIWTLLIALSVIALIVFLFWFLQDGSIGSLSAFCSSIIFLLSLALSRGSKLLATVFAVVLGLLLTITLLYYIPETYIKPAINIREILKNPEPKESPNNPELKDNILVPESKGGSKCSCVKETPPRCTASISCPSGIPVCSCTEGSEGTCSSYCASDQ
jgi:hypothetical protein